MLVRPTYLVMVTAENNNKFYNCFPEGDRFRVEYGRVNASSTTTYYPMSKWDSQINSKIKKGYKDVTDLKSGLIIEDEQDPYKPIDVESIRIVIEKLQKEAREVVKRNYTVAASAVTQDMIEAAQNAIDDIAISMSSLDVPVFNKALLELFTIIPRSMGKVQNHLAQSNDDYEKIIVREQDLLDAMRTQVVSKVKADLPCENNENCDQTVLEAFGLKMREASSSDIDLIKKLMRSQAGKFKRAWVVTNLETQKLFDDFVKENNISKRKLLWHGSRTENFWSIMKTGLKLRPTNAVITGKMFGFGTYFSPSCSKSIGYTSLSGSYWASGSSNRAYIALFDVAYGTPYDVYSFDPKYYDLNYDKLQRFKKGANCLHAHADKGMLRKDEIVVYKEEQMTIKYLIEIGQ